MRSEQKTMPGKTGRRLRMDTLSPTSLAPVLHPITSIMPKRSALVIDEDDVNAVRSDLDARIKAELVKRHAQQLQKELRQQKLQRAATTSRKLIQDLIAASQGKLQTAGIVLVGRISNRKSRPDSRKLWQRGGDVTDTLKERTSNLTQSIAERGDDLGQALAEYTDDLSHQLRKRGKRARRTLQKQNRKLQKTWQRRLQQQPEVRRNFWIALGFGFGLTLVGIITYQLLRHRLQRQHEEAALELPYTDSSSQNGTLTNVAPSDAIFVGVTSNKLYYPIETPLEQLPTEGDRPVEVVYFSSKQEAKKQGFQSATSRLSAASSREHV